MAALRTRADDFAPGDTDLAWTRATSWRAILASSVDAVAGRRGEPVHVTGGRIEGDPDNATAQLLAGWLSARLRRGDRRGAGRPDARTQRRRLRRPRRWTRTRRSSSHADRKGGAVVSQPYRPDATVALPERSLGDLLERGAAAARHRRAVPRRAGGRDRRDRPRRPLADARAHLVRPGRGQRPPGQEGRREGPAQGTSPRTSRRPSRRRSRGKEEPAPRRPHPRRPRRPPPTRPPAGRSSRSERRTTSVRRRTSSSSRTPIGWPGRSPRALVARLADAQAVHGTASVVLTGGGIGIAVLEQVAALAAEPARERGRLDGGRRLVGRRAVRAGRQRRAQRDAAPGGRCSTAVGVTQARVHAMPPSDGRFAETRRTPPAVHRRARRGRRPGHGPCRASTSCCSASGPEGHVASIFPEHPASQDDRPVFAVRDCPKPPPTRISLGFPAINAAEEVWLVVAGEGKAEAVARALAGAEPTSCRPPACTAAGPRGGCSTPARRASSRNRRPGSRMEVRVLGPLEVRLQGSSVALGARMERALLTILVLEAGRVVAADRLTDLLWDGEPPPKAAAALHTKVAHLRRALQPDRTPRTDASVIVTAAPGYRLAREHLELDADRFEVLVGRGDRAARSGRRRGRAAGRRGVALWRGPAFGEFADEPFARAAAERLETLRLAAVELRATATLQLGDTAGAVAALQPHVAAHPLREQARAELARALYVAGRQAEALAVLGEGRRLLREELGLDPGPDLRRLEQQILDQDAALQPSAPAPAAAPVPAVRATQLRGREHECAVLARAVAEASAGSGSVVLVTGDAGMGKSALLEVLRGAVLASRGLDRSATCRGGLAAPPFWPVLQMVRAAAVRLDAASRTRLARALGPLRDAVPGPRGAPGRRRAARWGGPRDGADARLRRPRRRPGLGTGGRGRPARPGGVRRPARSRPGHPPARRRAGRRRAPHAHRAGPRPCAAGRRLPCARRHPRRGGPAPPGAAAGPRTAPGTGDHRAGARGGRRPRAAPRWTGSRPARRATRSSRSSWRERSPPTPGMAVPPAVYDVLRQRFLRLPEGGTDLLAAAAVAGSPVSVDDVAAVTGLPPDRVLELVDDAVAARLLADVGDGRVAPAHALLGEAVLAGLSSARQVRLHRAIADRLAAQHGSGPDQASRIAAHYLAARVLDGGAAALTWLERAADHALTMSALDQLKDLGEQVLALLTAGPDDAERRRELRARGRIAFVDAWYGGMDSPTIREFCRLVRSWEMPRPAQPEDVELLWLATLFSGQLGRLDDADALVARMAALDDELAIRSRATCTATWPRRALDAGPLPRGARRARPGRGRRRGRDRPPAVAGLLPRHPHRGRARPLPVAPRRPGRAADHGGDGARRRGRGRLRRVRVQPAAGSWSWR